MNSRQLQYAVVLSETKSFSTAAEKLNISQPALSKQIIALENEIGVKLFDRGASPLALTVSGEYFIAKAEKLLFEEDVLLKTLEKYKSGERGKLVIGAVPFRSSYMMPRLIKNIKEKFPNVQIELQEYGLSVLREGLLKGEYDFAIMNLPMNDPEFEAIPLTPDTLVLAVPEELKAHMEDWDRDEIDDLSAGKNLPFVTVGKEQEMRKLFDVLCAEANIEPDIYATVTGVATAWEMVKSGVAATIIPKQFVLAKGDYSKAKIFEIKNTPYIRQSAVVLRRGQFISDYTKYAIDCLIK